jgi:hypothetical protein
MRVFPPPARIMPVMSRLLGFLCFTPEDYYPGGTDLATVLSIHRGNYLNGASRYGTRRPKDNQI